MPRKENVTLSSSLPKFNMIFNFFLIYSIITITHQQQQIYFVKKIKKKLK
jgi:hypothetical protein